MECRGAQVPVNRDTVTVTKGRAVALPTAASQGEKHCGPDSSYACA